MLKDEIIYLLNVRLKDQKYERGADPIANVIKNMVKSSNPQAYTFNEKVLVVLIESSYLQ